MLDVSLQLAEDIPLLVYLIFYIWLGIVCCGVCAATFYLAVCFSVTSFFAVCARGCVLLGASSYSMGKYQKVPYGFFPY